MIDIFFSCLILILSCNVNDDSLSEDELRYFENVEQSPSPVIYVLIEKTYNTQPMGENDTIQLPGDIDTNSIHRLNEPLKAMAAFYAAIGGSYCSDNYCELTSALGLGKQGSDMHKALIKKYFPSDKIAELVLRQDCAVGKSGSSFYNEYEYLTIYDSTDTIKVEYKLCYFIQGEEGYTKGTDSYLLKDNKFFKIERHIWAWEDN